MYSMIRSVVKSYAVGGVKLLLALTPTLLENGGMI
jgi:hypothetical protein